MISFVEELNLYDGRFISIALYSFKEILANSFIVNTLP